MLWYKKMWLIVSTAAVGITLSGILWCCLRSKKPKKIKVKELASILALPSEENIAYEVQDLNIPRLSGKAMTFVKWLLQTGLKNILGSQSIRKSNLDLLRSIEISDSPTIVPLPLVTWDPPPVDDKPVDFNKYLKSQRRSRHTSTFMFLSISDLTAAYRSKQITPLEVANNIIQHIMHSEERTPPMRIFTQYNQEEIRKIAKESTERYAKNKPLSFLDGVPVALKEEFDVIPYYMLNGTTFWSNKHCDRDASVVKKLRDGGAMIIGMTNMHEIGIGVTGNNPNRRHGTPRNPYNVDHYTGGSSSGSAAAVASGLCLVALGTDGGGSIRMPSGACGVVGIKDQLTYYMIHGNSEQSAPYTSFGRINTAGVVHTCHTVTHTGPICNSVRDAALVYAYIAGPDEGDLFSVKQPPVTLQGFENTNLNGIKIGIDWKFFEHTDEEVLVRCKEALKYLENNDAKIVPLQIPELEEIRVAHSITILVEMAAGLNRRFYEYFDELNPDSVMSLSLGQQFTGLDYFQAQKQRTRAMVYLEKIFDNVDCIITPGLGMKVPVIARDALEHGEANTMLMGKMMRYMALGNLTGIPGMTFPVGYDVNGLPISLQVMSGWWQEHIMLRVANTCEGFVEHKKPQVYYDILQKE